MEPEEWAQVFDNFKQSFNRIRIRARPKVSPAGTDKLTMADIGKLTPEEVTAKVRYIVSGTKRGYRPKPVRRKEIPKPNGTTRPSTGNTLHMGQTDSAMFQASIETNMRGALQQTQLRI